ncbi:MAG: hypothetical protein JO055_00405 [Alphaproteobacteria bacterium]|nr:hypothetical protein [Alphaproteobacteria bacterium]
MALDSVLDSLTTKLGGVITPAVLQPIVDQLATGASDAGMRGRIASMAAAKGRSELDDKVLNVMAGGGLGVLPGGDNLKPVIHPIYGWRVNSFLSAMRIAMVNSKPLQETMKKRSGQFIFYPEFCTQFPGDDATDQRIAAVARAHAGLGPSDVDLAPLYTLGGLFDGAAADAQLKAMGKGGGGTSCIMTARGVYHAAGCDMIDGGEVSINVPGGAELGLGTPTKKTNMVKNSENKWVQQTTWTVRHGRADPSYNNGKKFQDNNKDVRPHLTIGDIYMVEGTGDHLYLARGGGAYAVHVGIIVGHNGDTYYTVDGGAGNGADVTLSPLRELSFKDKVGWAFGERVMLKNKKDSIISFANTTHSFNDDEILQIAAADDDVMSDAGILARMGKEDAFKKLKKPFEDMLNNYKTAKGTPREKLYEKQLNMMRAAIQRLARQIKQGQVGEVRTIHGWWESESYRKLAWAGSKEIATLLK